jgi:hypothetical protein
VSLRKACARCIGSLAAFLLATLLVGCFHYNGESYSSQEAAFAAQRRLQDGIVAKIRPLPAPLAAVVRVGVPSRDVIAQRAFASPQDSRYVVELLGREMDFVARALQARGIFGRVLLLTTNGAHVEPAPGEAVVYFYLESSSVAGWYFAKQPGTRVPLFFAHGEADFTARVTFFLNTIEAQFASNSR